MVLIPFVTSLIQDPVIFTTYQRLWPQSPGGTVRRIQSGTRGRRTDWGRSRAPQSGRVGPCSCHESTWLAGTAVPTMQRARCNNTKARCDNLPDEQQCRLIITMVSSIFIEQNFFSLLSRSMKFKFSSK